MVSDELTIKLTTRINEEFPETDVERLRNLILEIMDHYEVKKKEVSLVATDIPERAMTYLAVKKLDGLSMKTLYNYKLHLERFCHYLPKALNLITEADIRLYLAMLMKQNNLKQTSMASEVNILRSFFGWLRDEDIIQHNPMVHIKTPKVSKRLRHALSDEEVELLRQACITLREKAIFEFFISSGCRLSEVQAVNIKDINWSERSLHVIGKGDKERIVYFSIKAKILLKKYLASRNDIDEALFVTSRHPYHRLGDRSIEKEFKRIAERTGFEKSIYPHLMRHSYATHNMSSGMSLQTLQHLLGHTNPSTTLIYAEMNEDNIKHEYRKIS